MNMSKIVKLFTFIVDPRNIVVVLLYLTLVKTKVKKMFVLVL